MAYDTAPPKVINYNGGSTKFPTTEPINLNGQKKKKTEIKK
jgi:hypothetical protein